MVTVKAAKRVSESERSQLDRKGLAVSVWRDGRPADALIVLESVLSEEMSPQVAAECWVTQAAFRAEEKDWEGSLLSLEQAAPFIDEASLRVRGSYYHQRARAHKEMGELDEALTDYSGAVAYRQADNDREFEGAALLNLAGVYLELNDPEKAQEYVARALKLLEETGSSGVSQAHETQASIYLLLGQFQLALDSVDKALSMVGENELWQADFLKKRAEIETQLLHRIGVDTIEDAKVLMARNALLQTDGSLTNAAKLIGLTHKGVDKIIKRNPDLESLRVKRRVRHKTLIKRLR